MNEEIQETVEIKEDPEAKSVDCRVTDGEFAISIYGYNADDVTTILIHFLMGIVQNEKQEYHYTDYADFLKNTKEEL